MDSPVYFPPFSETEEEPNWLDLAANAPAETQHPPGSGDAGPSLPPPPPPPPAETPTAKPKPEPTARDLTEEKPWQQVGYQAYCDLLALESDFFIVRRFGSLNVRVALRMQDAISRLGEQLAQIEGENRQPDKEIDNGTFREDTVSERSRLLDQISPLLYRYSESRSSR